MGKDKQFGYWRRRGQERRLEVDGGQAHGAFSGLELCPGHSEPVEGLEGGQACVPGRSFC